LKIGGKPIAKSTMEITPITLIPSILAKVAFDYSLPTLKKSFGANSKILPNISSLLQNGHLLYSIVEEIDLKKFGQVKISRSIEEIKSEINGRQGM
jgi:hypothetical protein